MNKKQFNELTKNDTWRETYGQAPNVIRHNKRNKNGR